MLISRYMGNTPLQKAYRFDEPWDGPNNKKLLDPTWPPYYYCPKSRREARPDEFMS